MTRHSVTKICEVAGGRIPALGFGTWQIEGDDCRRAVIAAIEAGYRHIDTAQWYGNEEHVGAGIRESDVGRDELFLTTKLPPPSLSRDGVRTGCEESLERLQTDYLDLLLIHWPSGEIPLSETMDAMNALREAGKAKHIGVSNLPVALLEEAQRVSACPLLCNQVEYHPYLSQSKVLDCCRGHGILLTAYSSLARGEVLDDPVLQKIGRRHGKSPAQVSLRWLLQQPGVIAVTKAAKADHARANLEVFDFELADDDMEAIFALARGHRLIEPHFAPKWDE